MALGRRFIIGVLVLLAVLSTSQKQEDEDLTCSLLHNEADTPALHLLQRNAKVIHVSVNPLNASKNTNAPKEKGTGSAAPGCFLGFVAAATAVKLASSVDDTVWLSPFVSLESATTFAICYVLCMQFIVFTSWSLSAIGRNMLGRLSREDPRWPLDRILELLAAILLMLYTLKLFREWWLEDSDADNEEQTCDTEGLPETQMTDKGEKEHAEKGLTICTLCTVSLLGSLDDIGIQVSLLLANAFSALELSLGVFFGSVIVVIICLGANQFACVARVIGKIPLWAILGSVAIWLLVSVMTFQTHLQ